MVELCKGLYEWGDCMNMLVIGNGFDLAHGRPTRYEDFLKFAKYIMMTKDPHISKTEFQRNLVDVHRDIKTYILKAFDDRIVSPSGITNKNIFIQEIYELLNKNVWYDFFQSVRVNGSARGKDWVDFESEIREVVEFFDCHIDDLYEQLPPSLQLFSDTSSKVYDFYRNLDFSDYNLSNQHYGIYFKTYYDFIQKTYFDLEKLIRCLEIYLDDCVRKMPITIFSPNIKELSGIEYVLSFNYTSIPTDIYPSLKNIHHIHGYADSNRPADKNNMVLGVNEYWDNSKKDFCTNFNLYKKFVQRIIKETGLDYKKFLKSVCNELDGAKRVHDTIGHKISVRRGVYIFGHSLDVTDGDILKEIILTQGIKTIIFYKDKQQHANQIANLSKVLGQDKLLECVFSASPTIIFKRQADMVDYPSNE